MLHVCRLSLGTALLALALAGAAASWSGGRGPGNCGTFPDITFPLSPATPAVVWKAFLGPEFIYSEANPQPPSNAVVSGELVIFAYGQQLIALTKETGELRWQKALDELLLGDLLLLDGQLIICGASGTVHALNPADASVIWSANVTGGLSNPPVYTDSWFLFSDRENQIVILARKTGKMLGSINTGSAGDSVEAAPLIFGKSFLLCYSYGTVKRIEASSMVQRWAYTFPQSVISITPVTDGQSIVVLNTANTIYAFNPTEAIRPILWAYPCGDRLAEPVALDGDRIFLATSSSKLLALDTRTGHDDIFTSQTTDKDKDGKEVTKKVAGIRLPATPVATPIVFGKQHKDLLVRMQSGLLGLYSRDTGKLEWLYSMENPLWSDTATKWMAPGTAFMGAPAIEDDSIYFAGSDGMVYHLSSKAVDTDPPTFGQLQPKPNEKGFLTVSTLDWVGAFVSDEGTGLPPAQVTLRLDDKELAPDVLKFQAKDYLKPGYYFYPVKSLEKPLDPGMHRLVITATNYRGLKGTEALNFFLGIAATAERLPITIAGEFLPKHVQVKPGTIITWTNTTGDRRTVIADNNEFSSDTQYPHGIPPGEIWAWIVPAEAEIGTQYFYHCRLSGKAGDGTHFGSGLAGLIEVGVPDPVPATPAGAAGAGNPAAPAGAGNPGAAPPPAPAGNHPGMPPPAPPR